MRVGRFVGHYFIVLGTISLLWMVVAPLTGHSLTIDLGFILSFWIGIGLLNARSGRRKLVIILFSLGLLLCAGYLVRLMWATGPVGFGRELSTRELTAFKAGIVLLLFSLPVVLLVLPATRRWFAEHREAPPPDYVISRRLIALYVVAACIPIAGALCLEPSIRTVSPGGVSGGFEYGDKKTGITSAGWMEEEGTGRRLYVSWLLFAESNSFGSVQNGHITIGPHQIQVPDDKPVHYLFALPRADESQGNVLLVSKDGTVTRLPKRVTPDQLDSAWDAARGVHDFEELRKRLEAMLPDASVAVK